MSAHKGASKEGKPITRNFPWAALPDPVYIHMGELCDALHQGDKLKMSRKLSDLKDGLLAMLIHPRIGLFAVNEVFALGIEKHGLRSHINYGEEDICTLVDALGRHLLKGLNNLDEESGLSHRLHAIANVLMIQQIIARGVRHE